MKVVGIIGSPHADGSGAALVREALAGAREAGAATREILLSGCHIEHCRDCGPCIRSGRCVVEDDFQEVRARLLEADGIIFSSPTYGAAMSARMKSLFDRLGQLAFLTSTLGGKYVVGIATAGSFGAKKVARQLDASVQQSVFRRGYVTGTLGVHLRGRHVSSQPGALSAATALGRKIVADLVAKKKAIERNKDSMRGVYEELARNGILSQPERGAS